MEELIMQEVILYLINNLDTISKIKEGTVSLIGVDPEELKAILEVLTGEDITPSMYYWQ